MRQSRKKSLLILGVYPESEGYPNIKYRLDDLAKVGYLSVEKIHAPIWRTTISNQKLVRSIAISWRFVSAHLNVLFRYVRHPQKETVYLPYPAVFISVLLSCLPAYYRPKRLVLDAFISLYDTICMDRAYLSPRNVFAKLLYRLETRAYRHCSAVIVDTDQNALYLSQLFHLPRELFVAAPLSTNEQGLSITPYAPQPPHKTFQILFIGTLIPLHGVEIILKAIQLLAPRSNLRFTIIGNGQLAPLITEFMRANPGKLTWIRDWQNQAALTNAIVGADICLGIFGDSAKAQRVCPLKIYAYAACGRAVITADTDWMRANTRDPGNPPFRLIPHACASALADAIIELTLEPGKIACLARAAREYYLSMLSNQQALKQLLGILFP